MWVIWIASLFRNEPESNLTAQCWNHLKTYQTSFLIDNSTKQHHSWIFLGLSSVTPQWPCGTMELVEKDRTFDSCVCRAPYANFPGQRYTSASMILVTDGNILKAWEKKHVFSKTQKRVILDCPAGNLVRIIKWGLGFVAMNFWLLPTARSGSSLLRPGMRK